MDLHPTPFPGKTKSLREKGTKKMNDPAKAGVKDPPICRQKRMFGTARTTNIPAKIVAEKPVAKLAAGLDPKQAKSAQKSPSGIGSVTAQVPSAEAAEKMPSQKSKPQPRKKKSVCFQEKSPENLGEEGTVEPRTPVQVPSAMEAKPRRLGTPYHTAENRSKCRVDKLETALHWLAQIKLAESVGKHFVSAMFFRLAQECKAEPLRNLHIELKRYLARHPYLSAESDWRDVSLGYGLLKDEPSTEPENSGPGKISVRMSTESKNDDGRRPGDSKEEPDESLEL